ncbi:MAG: TetR/AcrR family transcriptional regulator [Ilumatobacteraceae bacterium]
MGRPPDARRRQALLDGVVAHLAEHGLGDVSLRPMAARLHVSVNALVHHFGPKEDLVVAALDRATEVQLAVRERWLKQQPDLSAADLLRRWWRWMNAAPANLALVRLGIEAAALDATVSGLPPRARADQITIWRADIEERLVAGGLPSEVAAVEASLAKAMFTGLIVDLLATGHRRRLGHALEVGLARLEAVGGSSDPREAGGGTRATEAGTS